MSIDRGRGCYGAAQLARCPPHSLRRRRSWLPVVAVLGVGAAAVWIFWPRKAARDLVPTGKEQHEHPTPMPTPKPPQIAAIDTTGSALMTGAIGAFLKQLEDDARSRGFLSVKDYEDSVVASVKQLQTSGAKVALPPHLQHLSPRLEPDQTAQP